MSLVVDASVAIKWFVEEVRSDAARAVLDSGEPLIAPDLIVPEACNAAWKKVRRGELSQEHGAAVARALPMSFDRLIPRPNWRPEPSALDIGSTILCTTASTSPWQRSNRPRW
jgi:predicted nucleic acid-binding protein